MSDDSNAGPGSAIALVETKLLELSSEILGALNVKMHDNFFDLSGHSLLGIRALPSPYVAAAIATGTAS